MPLIRLVAVVGPTASGKTALAVSLAKRFGGEVVSADSMQVYKGLNIATAQPTPLEREGIPHHLIGYVDPSKPYNLSQYVNDAKEVIAEVVLRGKLPILAGGTGLYIDTLLENRDLGEASGSDDVRRELLKVAGEKGNGFLLEMLREIDPESAQELHENNLTRVVRALEVFRVTGITMAELKRKSRETPPLYDCLRIGITYQNRGLLYERINARVDKMLEAGLLEEAKRFYEGDCQTSAQAIGYKEMLPYLKGQTTLAEATERLKQATRHYAKRQLTWFRRDARINWLYPDELGAAGTLEQAVLLTEEFLQKFF